MEAVGSNQILCAHQSDCTVPYNFESLHFEFYCFIIDNLSTQTVNITYHFTLCFDLSKLCQRKYNDKCKVCCLISVRSWFVIIVK
jgi:hypothetical protein